MALPLVAVSGHCKRQLPQVMLKLEHQDPALLTIVTDLTEELSDLQRRIGAEEKQSKALAQPDSTCCRLMDIPGIGI